MLIKIENGVPVEHPVLESNFRALFPNTSFPFPLSPADLEGTGYGLYEYSQKPEGGKYEKIEEGVAIQGEDGIWRQSWDVIPLSAEEKASVDKGQEIKVRAERNALLSRSDWTQLADSPVNGAEWLAYRQALRDISSQPGFPWNVNWPTSPFEIPAPAGEA